MDVADAALKAGSPEVALQISSNLLTRYPNSEAALLTQGEALTALGRADEAAISFQRALSVNSASVGARIGLGRIRLATDPVGAEVLFLEAVQREPRNAVALNDLGIARDLQGRHAEAQTAYREALGADSAMTAAQVNLALSLAMNGQSSDAIPLLRPLASAPGASRQMRHDLAAVLAMGGDRSEAANILSKDLTPDEVQQALDAYSSGRTSAAADLLNASPPREEPAALPVRVPAAQQLQPGPVLVQLAGVAASREAAQSRWQRLREDMPELLGKRAPIYADVTQNGQTLWQVRAAGFAGPADANAFCERVRAAGTTCQLVQ